MEIRPIVSALLRHKTGTVLVALQIAVSLAIIVNALFIINQRVEKINRPTGMDVDNIIVAEVRGFGENFDVAASVERDITMLRSLPGVVAATTINHIPLSGSGSSTGLRSVPDETLTSVPTGRYRFDEHGLETLGVKLIEGRNFYPEEVAYYVPGKTERKTPNAIIVTKAMADKLYPDGNALGKPAFWGSMESSTIIGIIDHMQGSWVGWDNLNNVTIQPGVPAFPSNRYMIRIEPGLRDKLLPDIEQKLADLNRNRVIKRVQTHREIVDRSYEIDRTMANILVSVIVLLVALTALVTAGLASYFVSMRTKQIGTRRALGATRWHIQRYFLVENWIITTLGALAGSLLTIGISYLLETNFSLPRLDMRYLAVCVLGLWMISQFAAYFPALRAAAVAPAIATRSV